MSKKQEHMDAETLGRIQARYEAGEPDYKIAEDFGIHFNTINYHAKKRGWKKGERKNEIAKMAAEREQDMLVARHMQRGVDETEKFMGDTERLRALILTMQGRILKNRDPTTNELLLDKSEADLIFQYLKCCKISMEAIVMGYMGKRKALGMDERQNEDLTVLPWED